MLQIEHIHLLYLLKYLWVSLIAGLDYETEWWNGKMNVHSYS